jgi:hypothetical protein
MTPTPLRTALVVGLVALAGCTDEVNSPGAVTTGTAAPATTAPRTFDRSPEVLLSSRKPDKLIVAIDFAGSRAMDRSVPLAERRRYVLERAVSLYAGYAKKEKAGQPVRIMALSVPNRDDYARGDFRDMDELAVFDTVHATATDATKGAAERAGNADWRKGLSD